MSKNNIIEMDQLTDLAYYILLSLLEEKHGYSIMKHVETLTNGEVTIGPASLYPSLKNYSMRDLFNYLKINMTVEKHM
ncbi:PadR family transcriptional regulator [Bacillus toyonensis]|uniref:PadR family transcriptional regulator n=1 Tax=Bacillus toyonensis TaxID=155322 RepID=UPI0034CD86A0